MRKQRWQIMKNINSNFVNPKNLDIMHPNIKVIFTISKAKF